MIKARDERVMAARRNLLLSICLVAGSAEWVVGGSRVGADSGGILCWLVSGISVGWSLTGVIGLGMVGVL